MSEYYGVTRSEEYLAHYGVQGMKWGVRKAIVSGNDRALKRQFKKAAKKLAKLENNADTGHQERIVKAAKRDQKISAAYGGISTGIAAGRTAASFNNAINQAAHHGIGFANVYLPVGAGLAAGSIAANAVRKARAKKRLTKEGHAEAQSQANEFRREMKKAFKGTDYAKQMDSEVRRRALKKQDRTANYLNQVDRDAYFRKRNAAQNRGKRG